MTQDRCDTGQLWHRIAVAQDRCDTGLLSQQVQRMRRSMFGHVLRMPKDSEIWRLTGQDDADYGREVIATLDVPILFLSQEQFDDDCHAFGV